MAIFTTPNIDSLRARLSAFVTGKIPSFDDKIDLTHLCTILRDSLQKMLHRRELVIVAVNQYPPEKLKSLMFRRSVNALANTCRLFLPDNMHGDNSIYIVKHSQGGVGV